MCRNLVNLAICATVTFSATSSHAGDKDDIENLKKEVSEIKEFLKHLVEQQQKPHPGERCEECEKEEKRHHPPHPGKQCEGCSKDCGHDGHCSDHECGHGKSHGAYFGRSRSRRYPSHYGSYYGPAYGSGRVLFDDVLNEKARDMYKAEKEQKLKKLLESVLKSPSQESSTYIVPQSYVPSSYSYSYSTPVYSSIDCSPIVYESSIPTTYYPLIW